MRRSLDSIVTGTTNKILDYVRNGRSSIITLSTASSMHYQTTKGAKKHPASCKSARLHFISLAGLARYTEPRWNTVVAQESSPI